MSDPVLLTLDARRRISLSKVGKPEHTRYIVTVEKDGTIVLTPAVVVAANTVRLRGDR